MSLLSPQLLAFMAVADRKTVHAAADTLFLTQTAVTQRIRSLERSLNATLFIRSRRGMRLTPEGESLLHYCVAAKELEGQTLSSIQGAGTTTAVDIRIQSSTSIMRSRIIPACLPIMNAYKQLLFHFTVDDSRHLAKKLRLAETDFAIIDEEDLNADMAYKELEPEQYVLVASASWKGRRLNDIIKNERIIDYNADDKITFNYLRLHGLFDLASHRRYFINQTENLALLVMAGMGYTTLTAEFAEPYVKQGRLIILNKAKRYNVRPILAWYNRPEPADYFKEIIAAIH